MNAILNDNQHASLAALGLTLHYFATLDSTNAEAKRSRYPASTLLLADDQTAGRGQRGNHWESERGANLTGTFILEPSELSIENHFYLARIVALALTDTLGTFEIGAQIKWPNDIYVGARKVAGVLIENDLCGANIGRSIIGIGLNVNQLHFSAALPNPTSMALERGVALDRGEVLLALSRSLAQRFHQLEGEAWEEIERAYHERLYLRDREALFLREGDKEPLCGVIRGVERGGELLLEHGTPPTLNRYLFKEIAYQLAP